MVVHIAVESIHRGPANSSTDDVKVRSTVQAVLSSQQCRHICWDLRYDWNGSRGRRPYVVRKSRCDEAYVCEAHAESGERSDHDLSMRRSQDREKDRRRKVGTLADSWQEGARRQP